jgi:cytochrome c-type biogenesis protein CcmH/NrfF
MEIFSVILFIVGLLIFISDIFKVILWLIPIGSVAIMVISMGMLFNVLAKKKDAEKEKLTERIEELETQISKENQ